MDKTASQPVAWPTLLLILGCYAAWIAGVTIISAWWLPAGMVVTAVSIALHSSLQHEVLHGHPFRHRLLNEALVFPAIGLFIPYARFRDSHLEHHQDSRLTDPYDDPETNYLDPKIWQGLPGWLRRILMFNNTLLGRLLLGPAIAQVMFAKSELRGARAGDRAVRTGWLLHIPAVAVVLVWLSIFSTMPLWAYLLAAYSGLSLLKIRTFLEHRAHTDCACRTVIIEDRGPLAFLFLNNNLHVVHHMHPGVDWYRLPALYRKNRDMYRDHNDGYVYKSYGQIFRQYFLRAKDPLPHPLWPRD